MAGQWLEFASNSRIQLERRQFTRNRISDANSIPRISCLEIFTQLESYESRLYYY